MSTKNQLVKMQISTTIKKLRNQAQFIASNDFQPEKDKEGNFKITFQWLERHNLLNEWGFYIEKPISEDFEQLISPDEAQQLGIL